MLSYENGELNLVDIDESQEFQKKDYYDIAMNIYRKYTDSSLRGIHQGYIDKDSAALSASKKKALADIRALLEKDENEYSEEEIRQIVDIVESCAYKYDVLDQLIADPDISDINIYAYDNVRIKKLGKRYPSGVSFRSPEHYKEFVTRILERNNINFGTANAAPTFTDDTQEKVKLRISCLSELLMDSKIPFMGIRITQKEKRDISELSKRGMFDKQKHEKTINVHDENYSLDSIPNNELRTLMPILVNCKGILFTGKGASGKTTLMNALLELIPHDESVMIDQENPELFIEGHPETICAHVFINQGDSKISYDLGALTRMGLLVDRDRIIVGEIKQPDEALGLSKASMTGHKCWASVHGENCAMAIKKSADYISQANTNFSITDALMQVQGFEYVVHMSNFQIDEIVHIEGWDYEKNDLITRTVYTLDGMY